MDQEDADLIGVTLVAGQMTLVWAAFWLDGSPT